MSEPTKAELKVLLYIAEGQRNIARVERDEAEARMEAAEQQAARLRAALEFYADEENYRCTSWIEGMNGASRTDVDCGEQARAALAASQPAPAAEFTAQELDDIISGTLTVPRSVVERAMRQRGGQAEGEG